MIAQIGSISLWGAISAGPSGLSRALESGSTIRNWDSRSIDYFTSHLDVAGCGRSVQRDVASLRRFQDRTDDGFCLDARTLAAHLCLIEKTVFAKAVAFTVGQRDVSDFRFINTINPDFSAAYLFLSGEIDRDLYRIASNTISICSIGAISQLIKEAVLKKDEKAAEFLRVLSFFRPRLFLRPHYQFMVDGLSEMAEGKTKFFLRETVVELRRLFDREPIPPPINP